MANGENAPFRLDQDRAKALAAAGVPNASRVDETLERTYRGTVQIGDVSDLSPQGFTPEYAVRINVPVGATTHPVSVLVSDRPWRVKGIHCPFENHQFATVTSLAGITSLAPDTVFGINGTEPESPRGVVFQEGDRAGPVAGVIVEAINQGIWMPVDCLIAPGVFFVGSNEITGNQCDYQIAIQEYPGGVARTT